MPIGYILLYMKMMMKRLKYGIKKLVLRLNEFSVLEKKIIFGNMVLVHADLVQRYITTGENDMAAASQTAL